MARYSAHAAPAPVSARVFLDGNWRDPEERQAVKRLGARFDPILAVWWISYSDMLESPAIYRWIKCPRLAAQVKAAYDFNNYGMMPREGAEVRHPAGKGPRKARKAPQEQRTQRQQRCLWPGT